MMRQFCQGILSLAPKHFATARAPDLGANNHWAEIPHDARGMLVFDGASENTIYGDPRVNHAFRAWHDACHIRARAGFDLAGEMRTCDRQIAEFYAAFPSAPKEIADLLRAEIIGQAEYFAVTGAFPVNQKAFICDLTGLTL